MRFQISIGFCLLGSFALMAQTPGSLDTNFIPATAYTDVFWTLAAQADGKILVGGRSGSTLGVIYRLNTNGSVDPAFSSGTRATCLDATIPIINALSLQTNGNIVLGGAFTYFDTVSLRSRLAQLNPSGLLDLTFSPSAGNSVLATAIQPDGKIIIGGNFTNFKGSGKNYLARMNPDGSLDTTFNPQGAGPQARVGAVTLGPDGTILIGGDFTSVNGITRLYCARLLSDGTVDTNFDLSLSGPDGTVSAIAVQPDRKVILGGAFLNVAGAPRGAIARLNDNGTLDATFAPGSGCDSYVWAVAVQSHGRILAGGRFNNVNGEPRSKIACFNPDGTLDPTFDATAGAGAGASDEIRALQLQSDGRIIVAGKFTTFSNNSRSGMARLLGDPVVQRLELHLAATNIVLNWTGSFTLQSAANPAGPYLDVTNAGAPPCTYPVHAGSEFFRLRN